MICQICEKLEVKRLKVEKGVEIFECLDCQLGFIPQTKKNTILIRSYQDGSEFYDFKSYKKEEKKLRRRFEKLTKIVTICKKSGKVLDVGAGFGLFSSILNSYGIFQLHILEPYLKPFYLRTIPHRLYKTTIEGFLGMTKLRDRYDVIIMMDVIEHLPEPLENLKRLRKLLAKNGILIIQTPNYKSLMAKICRDWAWWMIEDHKFFFSPKSLKLMLAKAGFRSEHFMTYEDWSDFKKNLDGNFTFIKNTIIRKFLKTSFFFVFVPFYFLVRRILWKINYGGLLFVIAKK